MKKLNIFLVALSTVAFTGCGTVENFVKENVYESYDSTGDGVEDAYRPTLTANIVKNVAGDALPFPFVETGIAALLSLGSGWLAGKRKGAKPAYAVAKAIDDFMMTPEGAEKAGELKMLIKNQAYSSGIKNELDSIVAKIKKA